MAIPLPQCCKTLTLRWLFAAIIGFCLAVNLHPHKAFAAPCDETPVQEAIHNSGTEVVLERFKSDIHAPLTHFECALQDDCISAFPKVPSTRINYAEYDKRISEKFVTFFFAALSFLEENERVKVIVSLSMPPAFLSLPSSLVLLPSVILTI